MQALASSRNTGIEVRFFFCTDFWWTTSVELYQSANLARVSAKSDLAAIEHAAIIAR